MSAARDRETLRKIMPGCGRRRAGYWEPATAGRWLQAPMDAVCIKWPQFYLPELCHPGYRRSYGRHV